MTVPLLPLRGWGLRHPPSYCGRQTLHPAAEKTTQQGRKERETGMGQKLDHGSPSPAGFYSTLQSRLPQCTPLCVFHQLAPLRVNPSGLRHLHQTSPLSGTTSYLGNGHTPTECPQAPFPLGVRLNSYKREKASSPFGYFLTSRRGYPISMTFSLHPASPNLRGNDLLFLTLGTSDIPHMGGTSLFTTPHLKGEDPPLEWAEIQFHDSRGEHSLPLFKKGTVG